MAKKIVIPELLPCPFCGGEGEIVRTSVFWGECVKCGSSCGYSNKSKTKAIKAWNQRVCAREVKRRKG